MKIHPAIGLCGLILTLALGTTPMTLLELTAGYAGVAAGQFPVTPYGVPQVRVAPARQLPRAERDGLLDLLRAAVTFGTGNVANVSQYAYGKTGTTQDYGDAWFAGYTPDTTAVVWMGYPEGPAHHMDDVHGRSVTGGSFPGEIWKRFMDAALTGVPAQDFPDVSSSQLRPSTGPMPPRTDAPSTTAAPGERFTTSTAVATTDPSPSTTSPRPTLPVPTTIVPPAPTTTTTEPPAATTTVPSGGTPDGGP